MRLIGHINAGFPSAAEGYEDQPLNLHDLCVQNPAATFFYRVVGDELIDEHLCDGALLVVDRSVRPAPGKLVVAESDGAFVVCRFKRSASAVVCGVVVAAVVRF
ncbi:MAG: DNA polymerase V [Phycisphaerales bacterium]|nr:DNA polymerase V [Phycisphaerales bacterium]